jgi:hypothetical protein
VTIFGFEIDIFEREDRFDEKFKQILREILPDLDENYDIDDRARYKEVIKLEEYDKLLLIVKKIINTFNNYVERKKYGA